MAHAGGDDNRTPLDAELADLRAQVQILRAENARLLRLLELTPAQARTPGPMQSGIFEADPGAVHRRSPPEAKVAFFAALFRARTDAYAVRWDNARTGQGGWMPAVRGGWRKGMRAADRQYLPLTEEVITAHLSGEIAIGLYPMLDGDRCHWLAADFDGSAAMLDAPAYVKAARAAGAPVALEVSRSGLGAHAWLFFTSAVPAAAVHRELAADETRNRQVVDDVVAELARSRNCLVLTQRTDHLERLTTLLRDRDLDPVVLRGGMGARARSTALARLDGVPGGLPLLAVATGPYVGEGFDCPALDTLFLAAPIAFRGRLAQYAGRVLRPYPGKLTAEVHDYHDIATGVLASSLAKRAPGYVDLGFPDPRRSA